jgi:hypothetical protein
MTDPAIARKIEATGWSTVVLGVVCVALAALQAVLPKILARLAASLAAEDDPMRSVREAWSAGAGEGALVNLVFGVGLIVVGLGVARRARWAYPALTAASWGSIAVLVVLAKPSVAPFLAMAGGGAAPRIGMLCVAFGLVVAQIAAVLWFLRFWRKPAVRESFRRESP